MRDKINKVIKSYETSNGQIYDLSVYVEVTKILIDNGYQYIMYCHEDEEYGNGYFYSISWYNKVGELETVEFYVTRRKTMKERLSLYLEDIKDTDGKIRKQSTIKMISTILKKEELKFTSDIQILEDKKSKHCVFSWIDEYEDIETIGFILEGESK